MRNGSPGEPIPGLAIGSVIEVDGTHLVAQLDKNISDLIRIHSGETYQIGQFGSIVKIHFGRRIIYALVARLRMKADYQAEKGLSHNISDDERVLEADLLGEAEWVYSENGGAINWQLDFERGVSTYPLPQQTLYLTPREELHEIYGRRSSSSIKLGEHVGSGGAPCYADLNELLGKHTAILGSTGSGKSGAVASVVHSILERGEASHHKTWCPCILILDPHNEYGSAFPKHKRLSTDERSLSLPYWLLSLEETLALLIGKTEFAATSQANIVKNALISVRQTAAKDVLKLDPMKLTVDSPIPYVLGDPTGLDEFGEVGGARYGTGFVGAVNAQRPNNRDKKAHEDFGKVLRKLESLVKDERLAFMMQSWDGVKDPVSEVLMQFVGAGESVRIVDLSGVPNEVAGIASAAIGRTLFQYKVWQSVQEREASPTVLICEEAHRYVPDKGEAQYESAQDAIKRIAKEGRKYGIGLILVSQRPSEIESTVLSQCNSWIILRITNETDKEHVRGVLPDSMAGLTKMLSGLRRREAIFVGQAATIPSRILIRHLSDEMLPKSHDIDFDRGWSTDPAEAGAVNAVAERWRYQKR